MSFIMKQIVRFITCCLLLGVSVVRAETVMVATAANFATPMKEITAAFEKQSGHTVLLTFGSSGKFFAQIQNGAPFDLFLSADFNFNGVLISHGKIITFKRHWIGRLF